MNAERYTDRAKGFIQSAQSLATREGNPQFTSPHLLKVLLDDSQGLVAGLKRVIQRHVQDPLAEMILAGDVRDGTTVKISAGKDGLTFNGKRPATVDEDDLELA